MLLRCAIVFRRLIRKRAFSVLFLFFLLFSCCSSAKRCWEVERIESYCPSKAFIKAYLSAPNTFDGLEAEILGSGEEFHFFLNAFTLQLPCEKDKPRQTKVLMATETEERVYFADRLEGGQRLRLPDEAFGWILSALNDNTEVEITVGRYTTTLVPDNFESIFAQMTNVERKIF
jgi:hypothetical protein